MTDDPERRLAAHRSGHGAKYTRGRGPLELVYSEACGTRGDALRREAAMNTARKNLDWDGMRAAALDPELLDARREPHKCEEECAMCGNFCAVKMLRDAKQM